MTSHVMHDGFRQQAGWDVTTDAENLLGVAASKSAYPYTFVVYLREAYRTRAGAGCHLVGMAGLNDA